MSRSTSSTLTRHSTPMPTTTCFSKSSPARPHPPRSGPLPTLGSGPRRRYAPTSKRSSRTPPYRANVKEMISAFRQFVGGNAMMAYLVMMTPRLVELRRVLKPTGSIYLHCDPTASHYLKLLMDTIFGKENFRTEIVWKRTSAHSDTRQGRRQHGRVHDLILFYSKSDSWTWNPLYAEYDQEYIDQFYRHVEPETGRRYRLGQSDRPRRGRQGQSFIRSDGSHKVLEVQRGTDGRAD